MRRLLGLLACGRAAALFGFRLPWGDRNHDRNYRPRPPAYLRKRNATTVAAPPPLALPQYSAAEEQTVLPQLRKALSAVSKELERLVAYYNGDSFTPAKRRDARKITHLNGWGNTLAE